MKTTKKLDKPKKKPKHDENNVFEQDDHNHECERLHDTTHIKKLLNILSKERVDSYTSWIEIGMCLFNSDLKSSESLKLWRKWSKKSDKYKTGDCESI